MTFCYAKKTLQLYHILNTIQHQIQHYIQHLFSTIFENIKNQYISIFLGNIDHKINFTQNTSHSSFLSKKIWALHRRYFQKRPLFTIFLAVFTVDGVCNITNKNQPPSYLSKYQYFYTRDLIFFLHFGKKLALSIVRVFRNIYFLPHFHYF